MNYQKPELALVGSAISAIQQGLVKGDDIVDGGNQSAAAYAADE